MTSKNLPTKKNNGEDFDVKYGHILQVLTDWIDTTVLVMNAGRGMAKSTVIQARRAYRCVMEMPGGAFAFCSNTYTNLEQNIMPAVQNGWKLMGLIEGVHYVKGQRPPDKWRSRCSVIVDDYRYVYSFFNGSVIFLGSLDHPSLLAGKSVLHLFFDEAKYAKDESVKRALPILRGDAISFGASHLFLGLTITSDMPDITENESDWYLRYAANMDPDRIMHIVQTASVRNDILISRIREEGKQKPSMRTLRRLERQLQYYDNALLKLRKGQSFFINASSFVNVDILTIDYLTRLLDTIGLHEFKKSAIGIRPGVRRDLRFYVQWGEGHKYVGTLSGEAADNSLQLIHLKGNKPIDGGMDFGNMLSLVIGQDDGTAYRVHKNFFELPPGWFRELGDQFLLFFASHQCKVLNLYYDRAGNNFQRQGVDYATQIKDAIEKNGFGRRTGWVVNLKSRHQSTLKQEAEYLFMQSLMGGMEKRLPKLLVDSANCPELISSIEKAKAAITYKGNAKIVSKVKKSEKLAPKKLPMNSTNFSDAFKYLMMRREWLSLINKPTADGAGSSGVDSWFDDNVK